MKLLYISFEDEKDYSSGVNKKIVDQLNVFKSNQIDVARVSRYDRGLAYTHGFDKMIIPNNRNINRRKFLCHFINKISESYDVCYIRFQFFCPYVQKMVKVLFKKKTLIIMEVPTYPYEFELLNKGFIGFIKLIIDMIYRITSSKYISRFVVTLRSKPLFGRPCISVRNGINTNDVTIVNRPINDSNEIHLIAVALMANWHAYERLIRGLHSYIKKGGQRKIIFHLVGDGESTVLYKKMVDDFELQDYIIFHGKKSGEQLNMIYNISDIGVSGLGGFRKKVYKESNLKVLEYSAKGLPVICVAGEVAFDSQYPYRMIVPANESEIKVEEIVSFYDKIYTNSNNNSLTNITIREYCKNNNDISITFSPVIKYILSQHMNDEYGKKG
jgi:hypothetical protein